MFDQAEEVGPGHRQGPSDVVLGQAVELPYQRLTSHLELTVQVVLREVVDHGT